MNTTSQVYLVDGTYELFRSYFAAPSAKGRDGREVGAVRGLLRSLHALARDQSVTRIGVAFDTVIESFRNELFSGYKTGAGIEPELLAQFPLAERAAAALGMTVWPMVEFEADDALASAAAVCQDDPEVDQVVIASPDKDLTQCVVGTRVVCLDRARKRILDHDGVVAKFGIPPQSIPDYLALVGDDADGIPGLSGWGPKSTSTLLARYRTIDDIPTAASSWDVSVRGAARLSETLEASRPDALLYRTLATLRRDAPIGIRRAADLAWSGVHRGRLGELCAELDDSRFADTVQTWAPGS